MWFVMQEQNRSHDAISEFKEEELSKLKVGDTINCFLERMKA